MLLAPAGAALARHLAPALVLTAFALLMLIVGWRMWAGRSGDALATGPCVARGDGKLHPGCYARLLGAGAAAGVLSGLFGVGGGFILVPVMLYVLRMRAGVVVGTSLFQIIIVTAMTTILQAGRNQTVDIVLSTLLLLGGVVGAQFGARLSGRFRAEELRALLALIVLAVGIYMGLELFVRPSDLFAFAPGIAQ